MSNARLRLTFISILITAIGGCLLALAQSVASAQSAGSSGGGSSAKPRLAVIGAKSYSPRSDDQDGAVLAGEQALIRLSGPIQSQKPPVVSFDEDKAAIVGGYDNKAELIVRVPAGLTRKEYAVKVMVDEQELLGMPILSVYPSPDAVITEAPKSIEADKVVKFKGTGFFAPKTQITLRIGKTIEIPEVEKVAPDGTWFTVVVPREKLKKEPGSKDVQVTVWGVPASFPDAHPITLAQPVDSSSRLEIGLSALAPFVAIILLIWLLYRFGKFGRRLISALLIEPENETYSLSRAQFFWWLALISYCYLFLFFGRGLHEDIWGFPPLGGFAYTFMISLATLVLAQATNSTKGVKGSGTKHPSPADLIVNGGVLAPERVQQVVWTVLAGTMFVWITLKTYASTTALPTIPDELLMLMGISSAGYVAGKMARRPGPIIKQVKAEQGSVVLKIFGVNLSRNAHVWIDGAEQPQDRVSVLESDPDHPTQWAIALRVMLPEAVTYTDWAGRKHDIRIFNEDQQKAEWSTTVPVITGVGKSAVEAPDSRDVTVEVSGQDIVIGATIRFEPLQAAYPLTSGGAHKWTANVPASVFNQAVRCVVTNPTGEWAAYDTPLVKPAPASPVGLI